MKILVISNNPLSNDSSNGRTLLNMLRCFKNDEIYNFFITGSNFHLVEDINYLYISDKDLLFGKRKAANKNSLDKENSQKQNKRTAFKMLLRNLLWKIRGARKRICKWVDSIGEVDYILCQIGDFAYLNNLAVYLSKTRKIPLVSFISEDYYFKTYDYFKKNFKSNLMYWCFKKEYKKSVENFFYFAKMHFFLTEDLLDTYKTRFPYLRAEVIYNSSDLERIDYTKSRKDYLLYCGNLGVGRIYSLIKFAHLSSTIYPNLKIKVCSSSSEKSIIDKLMSQPNIEFLGKLSYEEVILQYKNCLANIHIESFDSFYKKDTCHAFSTKIADSLKIGIPFIVFAPESSSSYKYLKKNNCAFVCNDESMIASSLTDILNERSIVSNTLQNAHIVALNNHDANKNSLKFINALKNIKDKSCITALITTMNINEPEMIKLYKKMNLNCNAIIRSQNGENKMSFVTINGYACQLVSANDVGLSRNRNELLKLCSTDYAFFCDDDEIIYDKTIREIERTIQTCEQNYDILEYSFENSWNNCAKYKKNTKPSYFKNSGFGILNMILRLNSLSNRKIAFDENIGAGSTISCGEDSVFKKDSYKLLKNRIAFPSILFVVKNDERPSSWFKGFNKDYFAYRSFIYGMIYPFLWPILLFRLKLKFKKKFKIKENLKMAFLGKKFKHTYRNKLLQIHEGEIKYEKTNK